MSRRWLASFALVTACFGCRPKTETAPPARAEPSRTPQPPTFPAASGAAAGPPAEAVSGVAMQPDAEASSANVYATPAEFLSALPQRLATVTTEQDVIALGDQLPPGMRFEHHRGSRVSAYLSFPAVKAAWLVKEWRLKKPRALSGDVHQRSWYIALSDGPIPDPHGQRIATRPIEFGSWVVRPKLTARPSGPLPGVRAGASPAYDMTRVAAEVDSIEIFAVER